jgi:iron complex transport system permease protein
VAGTLTPSRAKPRTGLVLGGLVVAGLVLCVVAIGIGTASIKPTTVAEILTCRVTGLGEPAHWSLTQDDIVWNLRLPRVLLAILVGAALSVVGVVAQAVMRNPLADPYVLGISSG